MLKANVLNIARSQLIRQKEIFSISALQPLSSSPGHPKKEQVQHQEKALSSQEQDEVDPKLAFLVITSFKSTNSIVAKRGSKRELKISSCSKQRVNTVKCSPATGKHKFLTVSLNPLLH